MPGGSGGASATLNRQSMAPAVSSQLTEEEKARKQAESLAQARMQMDAWRQSTAPASSPGSQGSGGSTAPGTSAAAPTNISMVRTLETGLGLYVPRNQADALPAYTFGDKKVSRLYSSREKGYHRPEHAAERMHQHVERFLASSEITDQHVAQAAATCLQTSMLKSLKDESKIASTGADADTAQWLEVLDKLSGDLSAQDIEGILEDHKQILFQSMAPQEQEKLRAYCKQFPYAAKTLLMEEMAGHLEGKLKSTETIDHGLAERIQGLKKNLKPLCDVLRQSQDYKSVVGDTGDSSDIGGVAERMTEAARKRIRELGTAGQTMREYIEKSDLESIDMKLGKYRAMLQLYETELRGFREAHPAGQTLSEEDKELDEIVTKYLADLDELQDFESFEGLTDEKKASIRRAFGFDDVTVRRETFFQSLDQTIDSVTQVVTRPVQLTGEAQEEKKKKKEEPKEETELLYSTSTISAVKLCDLWVSRNAVKTAQGDSAGNFALELLELPFSERLFAYYLLENQKREDPSVTDALLSQNGYVPNYDKIKKVMVATRFKFHKRIISYFKGSRAGMASRGLERRFANTGALYLHKIEDTVRVVEGDSELADFVEKSRQERLEIMRFEQAGEKLTEGQRTLVGQMKTRHQAYIDLMLKLDKQRALVKKGKKDSSTEVVEAKREVQAAIRAMIDANKAVGRTSRRQARKKSKGGTPPTPQGPELSASTDALLSRKEAKAAMLSEGDVEQKDRYSRMELGGEVTEAISDQVESVEDKLGMLSPLEDWGDVGDAYDPELTAKLGATAKQWDLSPLNEITGATLGALMATEKGCNAVIQFVGLCFQLDQMRAESDGAGGSELADKVVGSIIELVDKLNDMAEAGADMAEAVQTLDDLVKVVDEATELPGLDAVGYVFNGVKILVAGAQMIRASVNESKQREGAKGAIELLDQEMKDMRQGSEKRMIVAMIADLNRDTDQNHTALRANESETREKKDASDALAPQLETLDTEIAGLSQEIETLEGKEEQYKAKVKELRDKQAAEAKKKKKSKQPESGSGKTLEERIEKQEKNLRIVQGKLTKKRSSLEQKTQEKKDKEAEKKTLDDRLEELRKEKDTLMAANALLVTRYEALKARRDGLQAKYDQLGAEKRIIHNTRNIQLDQYGRGMLENSFAIFESGAGMVGDAVPIAKPFIEIGLKTFQLGKTIGMFYLNLDAQDAAIDEFIGMDKLLADYKAQFKDAQGKVDQKRMKEQLSMDGYTLRLEDDNVIKQQIRKMVLMRMHCSSYEQIFEKITENYVAGIYDMIFKDKEGNYVTVPEDKQEHPPLPTQASATATATSTSTSSSASPPPEAPADLEFRKRLAMMFAPLTFTWPTQLNNGTPVGIHPSMDAMKARLTGK
ncbi:MAG: hypothetical protein K6B72_02775 [Lachnospiraceae bacterium]|nr:hypothetical protein [Lachnospiraceae bacterium]